MIPGGGSVSSARFRALVALRRRRRFAAARSAAAGAPSYWSPELAGTIAEAEAGRTSAREAAAEARKSKDMSSLLPMPMPRPFRRQPFMPMPRSHVEGYGGFEMPGKGDVGRQGILGSPPSLAEQIGTLPEVEPGPEADAYTRSLAARGKISSGMALAEKARAGFITKHGRGPGIFREGGVAYGEEQMGLPPEQRRPLTLMEQSQREAEWKAQAEIAALQKPKPQQRKKPEGLLTGLRPFSGNYPTNRRSFSAEF